MSRVFLAISLCWLWTVCAVAEPLRGLARLDVAASSIVDDGAQAELTLALTQAVPYRVFTLADPNRVVLEFREVTIADGLGSLARSTFIEDVTEGAAPRGWSRLVVTLATPMQVNEAGLETDPAEGDATVRLRLSPVSEAEFLANIRQPTTPALPEPRPHPMQDGRLVVVLDPGHGGVDPGAQRDGYDEADLMLQFAIELKEALLRGGVDEVVLTRSDDSFVSLPTRVSVARASSADVFLSLHADAIAAGRATGTTIYTLSEDASDAASAALAERQDRQDILAGVDLRAQDDEIATILMELARMETAPRSDRLADALVGALGQRLDLHKRPRLRASFSVLKAPDIPSVLIELGFMSSQADLKRLTDAKWRAQAAAGIVAGVDAWLIEDAAHGY